MSQTKLGYKAKAFPLIVKQGSTLRFRLVFKNQDGSPKDVSDKEFASQVRTLPSSEEIVASWVFNTDQASDGIVFATLEGSATAELQIGDSVTGKAAQFYYDMRADDQYFIALSSLQIEPSVTKEVDDD